MQFVSAFFLQIITIILLVVRKGRFAKAASIVLVTSLGITAYFMYHSVICDEYMCGLGDAIGSIGSIYGLGAISLILALIPNKKQVQ